MDNKLLSNIRQKHDQSSVNATKLTGICLVIGGVLITVGTYTGWIDMGNYFVFAYGPILGGLVMMAASKRNRSSMFNNRPKSRR